MKAIVTVIGRDKPGIIANVSALLAENNINIEDISQTVMQGFFTMVMLVNVENSKIPFDVFVENMKSLGEKIGVEIYTQHEDIFNTMHKV